MAKKCFLIGQCMSLLNRKTNVYLSIALLLGVTSFSHSAETKVYKWTDKRGKVHFSDKPFDESSEEIKLKKQIPLEQQKKAKAEALEIIQQQNKRLFNQFEDEKERKQLNAKQEKEKREFNAACQEAKDSLATLQMQIPVYEQKDNGKREYFSEERRKKETAELKEKIATHCTE
jgi:hypothetical protein